MMPMFHNNFFILGSVLLCLSDKGIIVAVPFFFSFKSCSLSCKLVLSICCSINVYYTHVFEIDCSFLFDLRILAVKNRFVLSVKLGCKVCYLPKILGALIGHQDNFVGPFVSCILLLVAFYFDLCRLKHLGI